MLGTILFGYLLAWRKKLGSGFLPQVNAFLLLVRCLCVLHVRTHTSHSIPTLCTLDQLPCVVATCHATLVNCRNIQS